MEMLSIFSRIESGAVGTSEFREELDEVVVWLDEVEPLLDTEAGPLDEDHLEKTLDKIKVRGSYV